MNITVMSLEEQRGVCYREDMQVEIVTTRVEAIVAFESGGSLRGTFKLPGKMNTKGAQHEIERMILNETRRKA